MMADGNEIVAVAGDEFEVVDPLPLPDVDTYYDDDTYYDQGHSTEVACGRTQVEVHDAAVGPTQQ
jgi:hypothetical protein